MLSIGDLPDYERNFDAGKKAADVDRIIASSPRSDMTSHSFGGRLNVHRFAFTPEGEVVANAILTIIGHDFPHLEYCPFLPSIISILLHHMSPDETLGSVRVMLHRSFTNDHWAYFPTIWHDSLIFDEALGRLIEQHLPRIHRHLESLHAPGFLLWVRLINNFFVEVVSLSMMFRIFDSYLVEGYKVLFRYCMAILALRRNEILACEDAIQLEELFYSPDRDLIGTTAEDHEKLSKFAYGFSFSRDYRGKNL